MSERKTDSRGKCDSSSAAIGRSGSTRRRIVKTTAGTIVGTSLAGCLDETGPLSMSDAEADPVTIGLLVPNEKSDVVGRAMTRSARLAVAELNEAGGINGRTVELAVGDTKGSALEARRAYQRLVLKDGADVTAGVFSSAALEEILPQIAEQETLHLTAGASTTAASRRVSEATETYKYHFRVGPVNGVHLGTGTADFVTETAGEVGWESVALLAEDYPWSREPWAILDDRLSASDIEVVMNERYPPATSDFSPYYDAAERAEADVVLIATANGGASPVFEWAYPNYPAEPPRPRPFDFGGIYVPLQHPSYYEALGGICQYAFGQSGSTADSDLSPATGSYADRYEDEYDLEPMYRERHTYDAITLFADAAARTGTIDSEALIGHLEDVSVTGTTGSIEFYGRDHEFAHDRVDDGDTTFFQWQADDDDGGVQATVWPDTVESVDFAERDVPADDRA